MELIKFDIKFGLKVLGHNEQEIRMTGDVVEPDLSILEPEFNFAGVPILMKATKPFHIENKVSALLFKTFRLDGVFETARWEYFNTCQVTPSFFVLVLKLT